MAAGRRSTRKADTKTAVPTEAADSTTKTIKAKGGKKVSKVPEKSAEVVEAAEVPESGDEQVDEVGDVEMENAEAEPKKPATKAASKKKQVKAKPAVEEDAEMEDGNNAVQSTSDEPVPEPKKATKAAGRKTAAAKPKKAEAVEEPSTSDDVEMPEEVLPKKAASAKVVKPTKAVPAKASKGADAKTSKTVEAKAEGASRGVKRGRVAKEDVNVAKKAKLDEARLALRGPHLKMVAAEGGIVLTVGQGDTGQIGLGEDVMEATKPKVVTALIGKPVVAICAGGMHSLCLTKDGVVYSFGCNDDGALGRLTEEDDETYTPGQVEINGAVVQISAGDSHSAALTSEGKVYYWGTFRDNSGSFGLTPDGKNQPMPIPLAHHLTVIKIASGENHIVLLTEDGHLFTVGCAEQGRLGRIGELFVGRGGRRGLALPLTPDQVHAKNRRIVFADVWAGSMSTVALTTDNEVMVCGLNNYSQLGIQRKTEIFVMEPSSLFTTIAQESGLSQVAFGQHHVMLLDQEGKVYSLGRHDYGVLGLGENVNSEVHTPTLVEGIVDPSVEIGCGTAVSYAVTKNGDAFSWGMGTNGQLSHQSDDDALIPTMMLGQQLTGKKVVGVSSGGQHTILLAMAEAAAATTK